MATHTKRPLVFEVIELHNKLASLREELVWLRDEIREIKRHLKEHRVELDRIWEEWG